MPFPDGGGRHLATHGGCIHDLGPGEPSATTATCVTAPDVYRCEGVFGHDALPAQRARRGDYAVVGGASYVPCLGFRRDAVERCRLSLPRDQRLLSRLE